jgi:drug/metabolite transporter (DMT)-like permease
MTWVIGVFLCSIGSFGTGLSKLAVRKSWLMEHPSNNGGRSNTKQPSSDGESSVGTAKTLPEDTDSDSLDSHDAATTTSTTRMMMPREDEAQRKAAFRLRAYGVFFMSVVNPFIDIGAYAFASPSILSPFAGVSMAWVVLLSRPLIGETPEPIRVVGACFVMLGEILVAAFGDHSNHNGTDPNGDMSTLEQVRDSYLEPSMVKFILSVLAITIVLLYWMFWGTNPFCKRFAWGVAGGILTGCQNFIKDFITMVQIILRDGYGDYHQTAHWMIFMTPWKLPWYFFGMLVAAGAFAGVGLIIFVGCMKRYDATYSAGIEAGSLTLTASLMSALHYHTFANLQQRGGDSSSYNWSLILYPTGLAILMVGVCLLMHHTPQDDLMEATNGGVIIKGKEYDLVPQQGHDCDHDDEEKGQKTPLAVAIPVAEEGDAVPNDLERTLTRFRDTATQK